jgi:hypothetical protein
MVFFLRKLTANFMKSVRNKSIAGLPLEVATMVDAESYEEYIEEVVMKFGRDAQGLLVLIIPIIMKIKIHIVNIDSS